jgi:hypothetical protein
MAPIVDEHGPDVLRGGSHEGDRGSAAGRFGRVGRQDVEYDHLAGGEAVLLIRRHAERCRAQGGGEAEGHEDQRKASPAKPKSPFTRALHPHPWARISSTILWAMYRPNV